MGDVSGQGVVSGPQARARVRVRFWGSCRGMVLLRLDLGSFSYVRETMRLWFQDYSEARFISKEMVEFQETGPRYC